MDHLSLFPGGSEENEPGEDQQKDKGASGSIEEQTESSSQDGNPKFTVQHGGRNIIIVFKLE